MPGRSGLVISLICTAAASHLAGELTALQADLAVWESIGRCGVAHRCRLWGTRDWAIHIPTSAVEKIDTASAGNLTGPIGLAFNESDRMCYIANEDSDITAVTFPARYFTVVAGTDGTTGN